jgi:hypothetical protein
MNDDIKKIFEIADYMSTLNIQKQVMDEEYNQSLLYYMYGGTFLASTYLIGFIYAIEQSNITSTVIIDENKEPINIENVKLFLEGLLSTYTEATNLYYYKYQKLLASRKIESILSK